jgi:hypothetical protein
MRVFNVGRTAQPLYWPVSTVGIFYVVGLLYWGVRLPYTSLLNGLILKLICSFVIYVGIFIYFLLFWRLLLVMLQPSKAQWLLYAPLL